jgi:major membrane immunogen (membrane-anchored lipoprotein)
MSNNYIFKNLKEVLTGEEQVLLEHDGESIAFVICGGFVTNISNENSPALAGTDDYIKYLKVVNTETDEETILYNDQLIQPNTSLPIDKIFLTNNQKIVMCSEYSNNLHITLSYFRVVDYEKGVVLVNFEPVDLLSEIPTWNIVGQEEEYYDSEYSYLLAGEYNIEFKDISGWSKPDSIVINIEKNKITEITATYDLLESNVTFKTEQVDIQDQFMWRVVATEIWRNNNESITLPAGEYVVEFSDIDDYQIPTSVSITIENQKTYTYFVIYEPIKSSITVNLNPPFIKLAKTYYYYNFWRIVYPDLSKTLWYTSGRTINIEANQSYQLEIKSNDYFTPDENNIEFDLEEDQTLEFNVNMTRIT